LTLDPASCVVWGRIHPNLKTTVYCSALAFGGAQEWDFAWRMFQSATVATESARLRAALACTKAPWLLNRWAGPVPGTWYHSYIMQHHDKTDRQRDRQAGRQVDRQTGRQTDRQVDRQTDR